MADRAVAEVEEFEAGDIVQARAAEHVERPGVGQRRAVLCIPVERVVEIDALELGLFFLAQGGCGWFVLVGLRGLVEVDRARGDGRRDVAVAFKKFLASVDVTSGSRARASRFSTATGDSRAVGPASCVARAKRSALQTQ